MQKQGIRGNQYPEGVAQNQLSEGHQHGALRHAMHHPKCKSNAESPRALDNNCYNNVHHRNVERKITPRAGSGQNNNRNKTIDRFDGAGMCRPIAALLPFARITCPSLRI